MRSYRSDLAAYVEFLEGRGIRSPGGIDFDSTLAFAAAIEAAPDGGGDVTVSLLRTLVGAAFLGDLAQLKLLRAGLDDDRTALRRGARHLGQRRRCRPPLAESRGELRDHCGRIEVAGYGDDEAVAALEKLVTEALQQLHADGILPTPFEGEVQITHTKNKDHGDFACNVAMQLARLAKRNPREIAEALVERLPAMEALVKTEIAGPGFINFYLTADALHSVVGQVLEIGEQYGRSQVGGGRSVQVEFVSANPTGPLHVGHGRGAAYGATVADLLEAVGYNVHREYYVNDAGRQMDILATSVWLRYLELAGEELVFPSNGYKGDYVWDIGATLHREHGDAYRHMADEVFDRVPPDEPAGTATG